MNQLTKQNQPVRRLNPFASNTRALSKAFVILQPRIAAQPGLLWLIRWLKDITATCGKWVLALAASSLSVDPLNSTI